MRIIQYCSFHGYAAGRQENIMLSALNLGYLRDEDFTEYDALPVGENHDSMNTFANGSIRAYRHEDSRAKTYLPIIEIQSVAFAGFRNLTGQIVKSAEVFPCVAR